MCNFTEATVSHLRTASCRLHVSCCNLMIRVSKMETTNESKISAMPISRDTITSVTAAQRGINL